MQKGNTGNKRKTEIAVTLLHSVSEDSQPFGTCGSRTDKADLGAPRTFYEGNNGGTFGDFLEKSEQDATPLRQQE